MAENSSRKEIIKGLVNLRERLSIIWQDSVVDPNTDVIYQRLKRWKERTVQYMNEHISEKEAKNLSEEIIVSSREGILLKDLQAKTIYYDSALKTLIEEIQDDPTIISFPNSHTSIVSQQGDKTTMSAPDSKKIFIVHGHDEVNTLHLRDLLRDRFQLEPVILSTRPGRGRTLIEKFEEEALSCSFAFVLLTPDDQIAIPTGGYTQARPNVLFELGWFYGRLGRSKVVLLLRAGTQIHSDLDGVSRIEFDRNIEAKILDIEAELKAAKLI